jgi:chemotaxis signal transduction protein
MGKLDAFVEADARAHEGAATTRHRVVLAFSFADARYLVTAERVLGIIAMRHVTRIPGAHPGFAGAIQHRGRVIGLLAHPIAAPGSFGAGKRVLVCRAGRGLIGLPASTMHDHQELAIEPWPQHAATVEHDGHAYTFIDPETLGNACFGAGRVGAGAR